MNDKYEFTGETRRWNGRTLHRIRALKDFGGVKAGDLGGWIESERNLSVNGSAWVKDSAVVIGSAVASGSAVVKGSAVVSGSAWVKGSAVVSGSAWVSGSVVVSGSAVVSDSAEVSDLEDLIVCGPIGSRKSTTTIIRDREKKCVVRCGCFCGTLDEFEEAVGKTHGKSRYAAEYKLLIEMARLRFKVDEAAGCE